MKSAYLVCYDIADEKRLNRVYRFMKERGFHIQYSVFYCVLTWDEVRILRKALLKIIHPRYDDVRIYPLPKDSLVEVMGVGARIPQDVDVFIDI